MLILIHFIGTVKDYIIVAMITESNSETARCPTKNFFWASSQNYIFSSLPEVGGDAAAKLKDWESCMFSGEFDTVLA